MRVLALVPYPIDKGPSQRFRLEVFLPHLSQENLTFDLEPFYSERTYALLYQDKRSIRKAAAIVKSYLKRYLLLSRIHRYDAVYIQRETGPLGLPVIAWLLKYVFSKPMIYDFDDAIWMPNFSKSNARYQRLKMYSKTNYLIKWSTVCSAGNEFLAEHARKFNQDVRILPTVVDTENYHDPARVKKQQREDRPTIGWTGTHSTIKLLEYLYPLFKELEKNHRFELRVISNAEPSEHLESLEYVTWSRSSEIEDLIAIDLGIMPMQTDEDDAFLKGKCGFKLIQYMSLGIPALASDVGVNGNIIEEGITGFLCKDLDDWRERLTLFLEKPESFAGMGEAGREKIVREYSVRSQLKNFLALFSLR